MKKITIIGTGAWGAGLGTILSKNGHKVVFWGIDEQEINDINNGYNKKYFGDILFNNPQNVSATNNLELALENSDIMLLAVPSLAISSVLNQVKTILKDKKINVINVAKGFDRDSKKIFSTVISDILGNNLNNIASLIGPSFAIEVFKNNLTIINAVGKNTEFLNELVQLFNNETFQLVPNNDDSGLQVYAALKNVLAIGIGLASTLYEAKNLAPAMISIGLKEIKKIAKVLYPDSLDNSGYELAAIGDIVLTCLNTTSRNFSFGIEVANNGIKNALAANSKTVEGYNAALILDEIITQHKIKDVVLLQSIVDVCLARKNEKNLLDFFVI
ncbi:glycerol-3-phosphate dehydrogenase [Mycoplasmopsis bovigenitalium]|uniref:Glycerol-3-phosphate dehydrogenase n=1 Tax=Mycoplasmopsis bovigenitalium TaxID=2112 RepID=A0A449A9P6_9BACT|nr:NAD(P)H-dependent glycerol-3-phosphate dehydrogenase [Mycoplasmopsis bovigenitalium]VEU60944.1 glycerol-3-phosphate dehydrogenase [Mycoplasmopsis bovigenitalium]